MQGYGSVISTHRLIDTKAIRTDGYHNKIILGIIPENSSLPSLMEKGKKYSNSSFRPLALSIQHSMIKRQKLFN